MENLVTKQRMFSNRDLIKLMIPLVVEQFLAIAVGMADSVMVASVGESAVSAVSLVDNISILLINIFAALATGGAVVAGQYIGQRNANRASKAGEQLLILTTVISLVVMVLMYLMRGFILNTVFGEIDADVASYCMTYMNITFASIPFIAIYNSGAALFRAMGNSSITMVTSLIMNTINIGGNAIGVYVLHLGIEGVALPTLASRMISALIIIILLFNKRLPIHIARPIAWKPDRHMVRNILNVGVPNGVENSMFQLGKIVLLSVVSTFGTTAIAANAIGNVISGIEILPGAAIGLGLITVVSQCVGAGDYEQVRYYTKKLMGFVYIGQVLINVATVLALPVIINIFHLTPATADLTREIILFHSIFAVTLWPLAFTFPNTLRASNDVLYAMVISGISMWVFRILLGFVFAKYLGMGVLGVWLAMIVDWAVRSLFFVLRYRSHTWEKPTRLSDEQIISL